MAYVVNVVSSLETAPQKKDMLKFNLSMGEKVNAETLTVDDKARSIYQNIYANYTNIKHYFDKLSEDYKTVMKYTKGMDKAFNKLSTNCKNQGQYCINRRNELNSLFEYADLEKRIADLEAALNQSSLN